MSSASITWLRATKTPPAGRVMPSFAFRHRRSFLSVRASQDPLHGQERNLAARGLASSDFSSDQIDPTVALAQSIPAEPGEQGGAAIVVRPRCGTTPGPGRARRGPSRSWPAPTRLAGRDRRWPDATQTPSSARSGSLVKLRRPTSPPTSPATSITKSTDRPSDQRSSQRADPGGGVGVLAAVGSTAGPTDRPTRPPAPARRQAPVAETVRRRREHRAPRVVGGRPPSARRRRASRPRASRRRRPRRRSRPDRRRTGSARGRNRSSSSPARRPRGRAWPRRAGTSWPRRRTPRPVPSRPGRIRAWSTALREDGDPGAGGS